MPPSHPDWTTSTQGVIVTNKIIVDSTCPNNNCAFTYGALSASPSLTAISSATVVSGTGTITLTGINLNSVNLADVNVVF